MDDVLAASALMSQLGYAPQFYKTTVGIETCFTLFGIPMCKEITSDTWCGSFLGSCLVNSLDQNDNPIEPAQYELGTCTMTRTVCGKLEDVERELDFEKLGGSITAQAPCAPATGLPSTTLCNSVESPGIDPVTLLARAIDPPTEKTPEAQSEEDEDIAQGEKMINQFLWPSIVLSAIGGIYHCAFSVFAYRRYIRAKKSSGAEQAPTTGYPTVLEAQGGQGKAIAV